MIAKILKFIFTELVILVLKKIRNGKMLCAIKRLSKYSQRLANSTTFIIASYTPSPVMALTGITLIGI